MIQKTFKTLLLLATGLFIGCGEGSVEQKQAAAVPVNAGQVNVYSKRHYESDKILFEKFTAKTGIKVNTIESESSGSLIERMVQEGANSRCDVFITSDAGNLGLAQSKGLLQPVNSDVLNSAIPSQYRDPDGHWFGLSIRARIIAYNKDEVDPSEVSTYFDLQKSDYEGAVLVRSSSNIYNQSLLAAMISRQGYEYAKEWASGIVRNMAREPKGGDTDQLKAVAAGQGRFAIANSYYLGRLLGSDDPELRQIGDKLGVVFPKLGEHGTHVNISGAGVGAHSPNPSQAQALLEFLVSEEAQAVFAEGNFEYPVREGVALSPVLEQWGDFEMDDLNLSELHNYNNKAAHLFDEVGWK